MTFFGWKWIKVGKARTWQNPDVCSFTVTSHFQIVKFLVLAILSNTSQSNRLQGPHHAAVK
jgi:hypothetical protein